jgi:hypothetical protein
MVPSTGDAEADETEGLTDQEELLLPQELRGPDARTAATATTAPDLIVNRRATPLETIQAVFCLEHAPVIEAPIKPEAIVLLLFLWTAPILYFLTGRMGPEARQILLYALPMMVLLLDLKFINQYHILKRRLNNWGCACSYCGCCCAVVVLQALFCFWVLGNEELDSVLILIVYLLLSVILGLFAFMQYTMESMMRTFHRQARQDDPSIQFWQRIDTCLVNLLRCIGVFIVLLYLVTVATMIIDGGLLKGGFFLELLVITFAFTVPFYFLVATLVVREDRPVSRLEFPTAAAAATVNALRRRTRQFVLNPDDPMGEPLLLV